MLTIFALMGFTAVITQVVLMRELLVVFYGNELALGIMLASWLAWTALGAGLLGRWVSRTRHPRKLVAGLQTLVAFALPLTLLAARASKPFCQTVPGEILGPVPMLLSTCFTLSVFCLLSGALFAAGSRLFADLSGASTAAATGAVYLFEAGGSGAGGLLAGLVLVRLANPFVITAFLGALNLLAAWALLTGTSVRRRVLTASFVVMTALVLVAGCELQPLSLAWIWQGFNLIATRNSVYGSLAVVQTGASRSLFENGLMVMTVPDPAAAEEAVHFALLEHPEPRRVLLIGGGLNGSVSEVFSHPSVEKVDDVEIDPTIFEIAARYFPGAVDKPVNPAILRLCLMDGRRFVKSSRDQYDVIIINLPDPHTAQLNRFYTEEFYREAAARLRPGGILSFQVTSSENYISQLLADFLRCLNLTLRQVFPEVVAIPGATVHFLAARRPGTLTADPQELVRRLRARHLHTRYIREYFLPYRMSAERLADLQLQIAPQPGTPVNHDFAPVAYYFDMALWSAPYHPAAARWFEALADVRFGRILAAALLLFLGLALGVWMGPARGEGRRIARARRTAAWAVAAAGFTELGMEILLLLGFQALYGYVYHELTILVATFMGGAALGAALVLGRGQVPEADARGDWRRLAVLQWALGAAPLLLFALLSQLGQVTSLGGQRASSDLLFPVLALAAGALGGAQFSLASRIYFAGAESAAPRATPSPGALYALDLVGASAGALALSILLIPIYGFFPTAVLMAAVNLFPAAMASAGVRAPHA